MRQFSILTLLIFLTLVINSNPSLSAIKGKVDYSIPVDYTKLSEPELSMKAREYYYNALQSKEKTISEDLTNEIFKDTYVFEFIVKKEQYTFRNIKI